MELGGARKKRKITFFTYGFSGISRDLAEAREAIIPRKWKNIFLVQNTWNIGFKTLVPRSLTMQLMPQLFLR